MPFFIHTYNFKNIILKTYSQILFFFFQNLPFIIHLFPSFLPKSII